MAARSVQVSLDVDLLGRIDADPEAREEGRSALIERAVALYLRAKDRLEVDDQIDRAYDGESASMLSEIEGLMDLQAWPAD